MGSERLAKLSAAAEEALATQGPARLRVGLGAAVVLVLLGLGIAVLVAALGPGGRSSTLEPVAEASVAPASAVIYVHVLGAVASPGLFELKEGARVVDAIAAAGGFTAEAEQGGVNLARFVIDGEQVAVPVLGAAPAEAEGGVGSDGRVNINTATAAELETLPRVGPAMAARILEWRESNGRFSSVEDLLAVTGIGEKTLAGMRDLITV